MKKLIALVMTAVMLISCTGVCMADETDVVLGDANMDNRVTLSDCALILRHIADWDLSDVTFSKENADVTMDSMINLRDVTCVLQKISNDWNP